MRTEIAHARSHGAWQTMVRQKAGVLSGYVYRRPSPLACEGCLALYTTDGTTPKVYAARRGGSGGRAGSQPRPDVRVASHHRPHAPQLRVRPVAPGRGAAGMEAGHEPAAEPRQARSCRSGSA